MAWVPVGWGFRLPLPPPKPLAEPSLLRAPQAPPSLPASRTRPAGQPGGRGRSACLATWRSGSPGWPDSCCLWLRIPGLLGARQGASARAVPIGLSLSTWGQFLPRKIPASSVTSPSIASTVAPGHARLLLGSLLAARESTTRIGLLDYLPPVHPQTHGFIRSASPFSSEKRGDGGPHLLL
jgi:hypothetical protein